MQANGYLKSKIAMNQSAAKYAERRMSSNDAKNELIELIQIRRSFLKHVC